LADHLREALTLSPSNIDVIPYGIDIDAFEPRSNGLTVGPPILMTVGRLERRKGVDVLLRAMPDVWRRFPDTQVHLIGNEAGLMREDLLAIVPECKRNQIMFPGFVERDQLIARYQRATLYVAPTQYETFGYTILEAMACGKAVISTRVGAIPELVEDFETGLLVPHKDERALAGAILTLLEQKDTRDRMGRAARRKVADGFSRSAVANELCALYDRVVTVKAR
jgi:glycosyltransferase involved in cell wall biosynthesis